MAVIGAGVAGAAAAVTLARAGRRVVLLERQTFPRSKVCGGCLHREGLATLGRLGLAGCVPAAAPVVNEAVVWSGGRATRVPSRHGRVVERSAFDASLVEAAVEAGACFREGSTARVRPRDGSHWEIDAGADEPLTARAVLTAEGLGGSSLKSLPGFEVTRSAGSRIGLGAVVSSPQQPRDPLPAGTVAMLVSAHGYLGLTRLGGDRVDLAAAVDAGFVRAAGGPAHAAGALARAAGAPGPLVDIVAAVGGWRATPPLTCRRATLAAPGLRVVGDAGGYLEPFTGEGMAWALDDAEAAASSLLRVLQAGGETDAEAAAWAALRRRRIAARQRRCRAVATILRRPSLTRPALAGASLLAPLLPRLAAAS